MCNAGSMCNYFQECMARCAGDWLHDSGLKMSVVSEQAQTVHVTSLTRELSRRQNLNIHLATTKGSCPAGQILFPHLTISAMEKSSQKKPVVQLTGFRGDEKIAITKQLAKLDCDFIDSEIYENCTHLIAKKPCRSEKWLAACASGKWVLTKDYIINSAESGRWLDETTYEWGYKIERDSHYSPQMQSAPKRWRQHLTRTGAPGAFSRWKVALLVKDGHKEREAFIRVLEAGQGTFCNSYVTNDGITHVFATNENYLAAMENTETKLYNAPYYPVHYLGTYLLEDEDPIEDPPYDQTDENNTDVIHMIWKHICLAQAPRHKNINAGTGLCNKSVVNNAEVGRVSLSRIEGLLEEQVLSEVLLELDSLLPGIPPLNHFQSLLKHMLQGNVDVTCFGKLYDLFCKLLLYHPPWESASMLTYYLDLLQCPICKQGTWSFTENLIRCFLHDRLSICHQLSDLEIDYQKIREVSTVLLKVLANIMLGEAKFLSIKLGEHSDAQHRASLPSFISSIFWSECKAMKLLTNQMRTLTDLVLQFHKEIQSGKVLLEEVGYQLHVMLGSAVEYWIFFGFYLDRNLLYQVSSDLVFYVCVPYEDFSLRAKERFILSITSPWLQMLVAENIFKTHCMEGKTKHSPDPLSLETLICTYIPAMWKVGTLVSEKVQNFKRKRKLGHGHCLQSQRASLLLNGENQKQGEALLDLPISQRIRRKTEAGSICIKDGPRTPLPGQSSRLQNAKGETALHTACRNNKVQKLITLLSLPGTDINVKDNAGWTPLHEACNHGSTECVREILRRCPDVDLLSHVDGVTPLHDALLNGHAAIGTLLLQYGGPAILQQKDSEGKFPLDYVISAQLRKQLFDVVQLNETIEDFHRHVTQEDFKHKTEFSAFLLSQMLLNLISLFNLPSNALAAKALYPNVTSLMNSTKAKGVSASFSRSMVENYISSIATMQKLSEPLQLFPETFLQTAGFSLQVLLALLQSMASRSPSAKDKENLLK
uniref:SMC5-SMC6 complex localization factor 1 n=1 Tax=Leptobrachium leishanense TaxID=445787 RepID=A0A8C5P8M4_9ANUR